MIEGTAPHSTSTRITTTALGSEDIFGIGRPIGEVLRDFCLISKLGEGGMGVVYKAHQLSLDQDVALKILPPRLAENLDFVQRFYREARMSVKLKHAENIVHGVAVGFICAHCGYNGPPEMHPQHPADGSQPHGLHYFAMEFVDGKNLDQWLSCLGRIPIADAVKVTIDVARALAYAHSCKPPIFHRDVKPANIMITPDGEVKLADLGLAKAAEDDSGLTQIGEMAGTPAYMPPEQGRNAAMVDGRSDIYALGTTLYVLLTANKPFSGRTLLDVVEAKGRGEFPPARSLNPAVPEVLDRIIAKMLAPHVSQRYQTAGDVVDALVATGLASRTLGFVHEDATVAVPPVTAPRRRGEIGRRRRVLSAIICALAVAVLVGGYESYRLRRQPVQRARSGDLSMTQAGNRPAASPPAEPPAMILAQAFDQIAAEHLLDARDTLVRGLAADRGDLRFERPLRELERGTLVLFQYQTPEETTSIKPLWLADRVTLTQRDNYRFAITASRPCYVYAYQRDTRPSVTRLFPNARYSRLTNPIAAGSLAWLPDDPTRTGHSWFHLDSAIGEESVYFVAITAPLRDPDSFGNQLVDKADVLSRTLQQNLGSFLEDTDAPAEPCFAADGAAMQVFRFQHQ